MFKQIATKVLRKGAVVATLATIALSGVGLQASPAHAIGENPVMFFDTSGCPAGSMCMGSSGYGMVSMSTQCYKSNHKAYPRVSFDLPERLAASGMWVEIYVYKRNVTLGRSFSVWDHLPPTYVNADSYSDMYTMRGVAGNQYEFKYAFRYAAPGEHWSSWMRTGSGYWQYGRSGGLVSSGVSGVYTGLCSL